MVFYFICFDEVLSLGSTKNGQLSLSENKEQYMSSKQWLLRYGIDARKLNLYDCLSGMFFRHKDGVVVIMEKPPVGQQTDAVSLNLNKQFPYGGSNYFAFQHYMYLFLRFTAN